MILQLNPPLPMDTARGPGLAHFMIDYGPEEHLMWVVFMDADGACWTVPNPEVRMQANWSIGRRPTSKPFGKTPPAPIITPPDAAGVVLDGHPGSGPSPGTEAGPNGHPVPPALNGYLNGSYINGNHVSGHASGPISPRYDAAPAA